VTDIPVGSPPHQSGGILKVAFRFPRHAQQIESLPHQEKRKNQQQPRDDLMGSEWVTEPILNIQQKQDQDRFECEEPVEAMGSPIAK
jgi:hypothetical protein